MALVALVPARAGSKGIPGKNIKLLAGKPLIAYTAEAIAATGVFDRAVLSTDSEEVASVGRRWGLDAPFLRPAGLADDAAPMIAVINHALDWLEAEGTAVEIMVLLQPTQPLRDPGDIVSAVEILKSEGCDSVASVVPVPLHMSPDYVMRIDADGRLVNFLETGATVTRRQDVRPAYVRDGTVYAFRGGTPRRYGNIYGRVCRPLVIEARRSQNIDTPEDWEAAERAVIRMGKAHLMAGE